MAWHSLGWSPAFFSEIDAFPSAVLAHHYGSNMPGEPLAKNGIPNYGDFTQIGPDAGPIDLLVGGTPCQSFSVAGKRLGLDDPRGNLALEYLALARRVRARWIVWENVPGVLSSHTDDEQDEKEKVEGDEGLESADFATFLSFVQECGYGFAYRVLDAQYIRVDDYARAVPQRRRRVFLVGYLGDWRRAAAVLLEPEGMRGDSAPRREEGEGAAGAAAYGIDSDCLDRSGEGAGRSAGERSGLGVREGVSSALRAKRPNAVAFGGNNTAGPIEIATALNAHGGPRGRLDFESETFVAQAFGFDWYASQSQSMPVEEFSPPLKTTMQPAVAWSIMPQNSGKDYKARQVDVAQPVMAGGPVGGNQGGDYIQQAWAVRRLTPRECERLQGFPDDFTNIPWRNKPTAPDGPRYKALGNSMAVNAMRWIGQRIDIMEKLIKSGRIAA
nr:DNA cytosine methyltransferase [Sinorhizobium meliloti]